MFCWYWWNFWPSLFKLSFVLLILVELSTITVSTFFSFVDIGGIVDHHCFNFLLFSWYWWNCWPSLLKISFVFLILVELLTITAKNFFCFADIGGIVDHHCLNFSICSYWWKCWPSLFKLSFVIVDIGGIVDHYCFTFSVCWYLWKSWPKLF